MILIYGLTDGDGRVRYIGASTKDAQYVLSHHRSASKSLKKQTPVNVWVQETGDAVRLVELQQVVPEDKVPELAKEIQHHRDSGADLLNVTAAEHAAKVRAAMADPQVRARISQNSKGRVNTPEHRAAISEANRGRVISEEHKAVISKTHKGKVLSEETRAKIAEKARGHRRNEGRVHTDEAREKMSRTKCVRTHINKGIRKDGCRWCEARYSN